jgi:small-conductance mechanosensitive channel
MIASALGLMVVLGLARWLEPSPRGFGTHTQLGLAPCAFAIVTGRLCPTCGMTTSFAWFARGRLDRSWRANPAGSLLAPTCVALIPWLLFGALFGRPPGFRSLEQPLIGLVVATVALSLISWTIRLILGRA